MPPDTKLARRAVACKGWRWMPGMLNGRDGSRHMGGREWAWQDPYRHHALGIEIDDWPDLSDDGTLGCLRALVREAWGDPYAFVEADPLLGFRVVGNINDGPITGWHSTEAEALVAALEAAP